MSSANGVHCSKCKTVFHRSCASASGTPNDKSEWMCMGCKTVAPREENPTASPRQDNDHHDDVCLCMQEPTKGHTAQGSVDLTSEIRSLRNEIGALRTEVREYREEILDFKSQLKSYNDMIFDLENRVSIIEEKFEKCVPTAIDPVEDSIAELKYQLNERDQELLLSDVEIAGVSEYKDESVLHIVKLITLKLGVAIEDRDVVHAERVGSSRRNRTQSDPNTNSQATMESTDRPRNIIVRFARRATRDQVLRAARVRRRLSTTDLEMPGVTRRVYINERLTRANRQLFHHARQAAGKHNWKYIWTKEGKILTRKVDGQKAERIRCEKDISKIFG